MNRRLLGALLLIAGFVLLVTAPEGFNVLHFAGFLGCVVSGMLLVCGLIGRSSRIRALQAGQHEEAHRRERLPVTAAREFRYQRPGLAVKLTFTVLSLLWVPLAGLVFAQEKFSIGERLGIGVALLVPAVLTWWYYVAHYRQAVSVDKDGIRGRGYLRTVTLRWDEVVALEALTVRRGIGTIGRIYRVYGTNRTVRFFGSVEHVDELVAIVRDASGIDWNG